MQITMNGVACYKEPATLVTDKKVTLVYGLNGTGKSTISRYLYTRSDSHFSLCTTDIPENAEILVYNDRFVSDHFHEMDKMKGIFTLSQSNKKAEEDLAVAKSKLKQLIAEKTEAEVQALNLEREISAAKEKCEEVTWTIKTKYSGGDRVLEYCLDGTKSKERLFNALCNIDAPTAAPLKTIHELKMEVDALAGENARSHSRITKIYSTVDYESANFWFEQPITGSNSSPLSELITQLNNQDWVKSGIRFMNSLQENSNNACPFCQQQTVNQSLAEMITDYFDENYLLSIKEIEKIINQHRNFFENIKNIKFSEELPIPNKDRVELFNSKENLEKILQHNENLMQKKSNSPSIPVTLDSINTAIESFNEIIEEVNIKIDEHNSRIENKKTSLSIIKTEFWQICRTEYDQTISFFESLKADKGKLVALQKNIAKEKEILINDIKIDIDRLQKETVNIEAAITVINQKLIDLGIDSFQILKNSDTGYRLSRNGQTADSFQSLSEGEKTVITFLYFVETCKGISLNQRFDGKKIIVFDDPISSLSHIYIFNIGEVIKRQFFSSENFDKILVFTHSLYFFYELTDIKAERRHENQKLIRITKNNSGSKFIEMKYEEIQNDYQSYWSVINDRSNPPAIIANCMRNIIEYFFHL